MFFVLRKKLNAVAQANCARAMYCVNPFVMFGNSFMRDADDSGMLHVRTSMCACGG